TRLQGDWSSDVCSSDLKFLSNDEIARANRFCFELDRDNFIVARAFLRIITGYYLRADPCELRFDYGKHGKPLLGNAVKDGRRLRSEERRVGKEWRSGWW